MLASLIATLCLVAAHLTPSADDSAWAVVPAGSGGHGVEIHSHSEQGFGSFEEAVASVGASRPIGFVRLRRLTAPLPYEEIQADLRSYLARHHPEELAAAARSSGNMHNPAVKALPITRAFLSTRFVRELDDVLRRHGHHISGLQGEKLVMATGTEELTFHAMWYLVVSRLELSDE